MRLDFRKKRDVVPMEPPKEVVEDTVLEDAVVDAFLEETVLVKEITPKVIEEIAATVPIKYQYQQIGTDEWVTCTKEMYDKLRDKYINSYNMRII